MPHYVPLSLGLSMGRGSSWGLRCPGPGQMWPGHARCPHACRGPASLSSTDTGGPLPLPSLYHLVLLMLEKLPKLWSNLLSPQGKFPYFPPGLWGQCKLGLRSRQKLSKEIKKGQRKKTQGRREEKEVGWVGGETRRGSQLRDQWEETGMKESSTPAPWHVCQGLTCKGQDTCSLLTVNIRVYPSSSGMKFQARKQELDPLN